MAYDIYDDTLDGEGGAAIIPCANFFLRALANIYSTFASRVPDIGRLFDEIMDRIDNANIWEQKYCRLDMNSVLPRGLPCFGDYHTLADRSMGHAMSPLAELLIAGYRADSEEYKSVESFFRCYLIARQLHDDAHDWVEDLLRGRVNSIGSIVLDRYHGRCTKRYSNGADGPPIADAMPELRTLFWEEAIDDAAHLILFHIAEARRARTTARVLDGADFMESVLRTLESAARRAIKERDESLIFLNDYRSFRPSGAPF